MEHARKKYGVSERYACRVLQQWRGTQHYQPMHRNDEDALTRDIIALGSEYGRYGYRRITALLQARGWQVGKGEARRIVHALCRSFQAVIRVLDDETGAEAGDLAGESGEFHTF